MSLIGSLPHTIKRLHTAGENLSQIQYFLDPVLALLASIGVANLFVASRHQDGRSSYVSVRAGQVMSQDGHPISSRNPGGR